MLDRARAWDPAERRLELTEDRRLSCGEAHIACEHKLAADAAYAALDERLWRGGLRSGGGQEADRLFVQLRGLLP